jgi:ABC-type transport system involved in cytochrome bd biosynthesis fused ATPase/permease subunit
MCRYHSQDLRAQPLAAYSIFGRVVDYGTVRHMVERESAGPGRGISGGQAQRVAL